MIAGIAALAAFAIASPSFAQQEEPAATPAPVPTTKPKPGTAAHCQTLKSASSRSACMKKLHAQATPKAAPAKKTKKTTTAPKPPDVGQLGPTPANTAATPTPAPAPTGGTIAVPPLPQKTI